VLVVELARVRDLRDQLQGVADVLRRRFLPAPLLSAPPAGGATLELLAPLLAGAPLDGDERERAATVAVAALGSAAAIGRGAPVGGRRLGAAGERHPGICLRVAVWASGWCGNS